jgi:hypothetical protein
MANFLSLPREIRDEIIRFALLPDLLGKESPMHKDITRLQRQSEISQLAFEFARLPKIETRCPSLLLVNHQIAAETIETINRCKELRRAEVLVEIIEEQEIRKTWLRVPTYDCFRTMDSITITVRISPNYKEPWAPSVMTFVSLWIATVGIAPVALRQVVKSIDDVLEMRSLSRPTASYKFLIHNVYFNIETPSNVTEARFGPPTVRDSENMPVPRRSIVKDHVLDPDWLAKELATLILPKLILHDQYARRDGPYGCMFDRIGNIIVQRDGKNFGGQDQLPLSMCMIVTDGLLRIQQALIMHDPFCAQLCQTTIQRLRDRIGCGLEVDEAVFVRLRDICAGNPSLLRQLDMTKSRNDALTTLWTM